MAKSKKATKRPQNPLDMLPKKKGKRGLKARMRPSEIAGRAKNHRFIFNQIWDRLWPLLTNAQTEGDVTAAFQQGASPYTHDFMPGMMSLILKVLRDPKFPKEKREAQVNFMADSLAGVGVVSPSRSRDICWQERAKEKSATHIIRYEYYVECSCGYKGKSLDHACPKCGARISFSTLHLAFAGDE